MEAVRKLQLNATLEMSHYYSITCILLLTYLLHHVQIAYSVRKLVRAVTTTAATCNLTDEELANARNQILQDVATVLNTTHPCGSIAGWRRVAYLDMTDPSQSWPSGLAFKSISGLRLCGRADTNPGCWSTIYDVSGVGTTMCVGESEGTKIELPVHFILVLKELKPTIYVEGVSLTYGAAGHRQHIWTFVSGLSEVYEGEYPTEFYECVTNGSSSPPAFVGNDYFCENGLNTPLVGLYIFYPNDPLWDGQNCTSSCCQFNNPPYFTKTLPATTSENIELHICTADSSEDHYTPIDQVELYVK